MLEKLKGRRPFWAHGVSVGEVQALMPVISAARYSGYNGPIILSTTTETGKDLFWAMQKLEKLPRNLKLIELINTIYKAPKDAEGDIE